ncbi:MAG: hypothetical protein U9N44_05345, partial [Chloroflexota bacterium]|nr:hypothetical protein [Chloroflexota bacterium]
MSGDNATRKNRTGIKLIWAIPVIVILIVVFVNLFPFGGSPSHSIDVGGNDEGGKAHLSSPTDGFSEKLEAEGITYREITQDTVYFEIDDPRLDIADEVEVTIRFIDEFPGDGMLIIGAQGGEGYNLRYAYAPLYDRLKDLPLVTKNDSVMVYATDTDEEPPLASLIDPL